MKREFVLNGSIVNLSKEEFIAAADHSSTERAIFKAMTQEPDYDDDDDDDDHDDDDNGEVIANSEELREISMMLGLDK